MTVYLNVECRLGGRKSRSGYILANYLVLIEPKNSVHSELMGFITVS